MNELRKLDLFCRAAGGWSLGLRRAGFTTVAACQIDLWRRAVLGVNNPGARLYDDIWTLAGSDGGGEAAEVLAMIRSGARVMVCGGRAMAEGVTAALISLPRRV